MNLYNRVYVAGASSERNKRAKPVIAQLKEAGFYITHDWTVDVDMSEEPGAVVDNYMLADCAQRDLEGVRSCDILVLLAPQNPSTGAWVELGLALGSSYRQAVYIAGNIDKCIFGLLVRESRRFITDQELVKYLIENRFV